MLRSHAGHDNDNRTEGTDTRSPPLPKRKSKLAGGSVPLYRAAFFAECKLIARWRAGRPWTQSLNPPLRYAHVDSMATAEAAAASSHDPHDASAYRAFIGVRGSVLVTSHGDGTVRMHSLETNGQVDMSTVPPRTVMARHSDRAGAAESVAVVSLAAPDDVDGDGPAHVWTGGMDSSVCVWDLKSRTRVVRITNAHPSPVLCMHGCDGAVITGSLCGSVRLWTGPSLDESTAFSEVRACVRWPAHSRAAVGFVTSLFCLVQFCKT
jgi:WD40 repeat protein